MIVYLRVMLVLYDEDGKMHRSTTGFVDVRVHWQWHVGFVHRPEITLAAAAPAVVAAAAVAVAVAVVVLWIMTDTVDHYSDAENVLCDVYVCVHSFHRLGSVVKVN